MKKNIKRQMFPHRYFWDTVGLWSDRYSIHPRSCIWHFLFQHGQSAGHTMSIFNEILIFSYEFQFFRPNHYIKHVNVNWDYGLHILKKINSTVLISYLIDLQHNTTQQLFFNFLFDRSTTQYNNICFLNFLFDIFTTTRHNIAA